MKLRKISLCFYLSHQHDIGGAPEQQKRSSQPSLDDGEVIHLPNETRSRNCGLPCFGNAQPPPNESIAQLRPQYR
eukprot:scaffold349467_cov43-Prasinocladus_malaysianus.AAC.2